jgi:hypothetical protein
MIDEVDLSGCDLSKVKKIKFKAGAKVNLANVKNLSKDIDLSNIGEVNISGLDLSYMDEMPKAWSVFEHDNNTRFPKKMTFKEEKVRISGKNIEKCEEIKFESTVKEVKFAKDTIFPEVLDLSKVDEVYLSGCDLSGVKDIKFKEGVKMHFTSETRFPKKFKFEGEYLYVKGFAFDGWNIEKCEEIIFGENIENVYFSDSTKYPQSLSISGTGCAICETDLSKIKELKLIGYVKLPYTLEYPEILDLSECEKFEMNISIIEKMNTIVFKDKEQRDKIMKMIKFERGIDKLRFKRKCVYKTIRNKTNTRVNQELGKDMEM